MVDQALPVVTETVKGAVAEFEKMIKTTDLAQIRQEMAEIYQSDEFLKQINEFQKDEDLAQIVKELLAQIQI